VAACGAIPSAMSSEYLYIVVLFDLANIDQPYELKK